MAARVRLRVSRYYEDQDGKKYGPGETLETDEAEAQNLINGGSADRVDAHGHVEEGYSG